MDSSILPTFCKHVWHLDRDGYLRTNVEDSKGRRRQLYFHHLVCPPRPGLIVDHINRNKLDNRASNLRLVSPSDSARNTLKAKSSTGMVGVYKKGNRFVVKSTRDGRRVHVGSYKTLLEAAMAFDDYQDIYHPNVGPRNRERLDGAAM